MKFAPSSAQVVILGLLAFFLATACGDDTPSSSRGAPKGEVPFEDPPADDAPADTES